MMKWLTWTHLTFANDTVDLFRDIPELLTQMDRMELHPDQITMKVML